MSIPVASGMAEDDGLPMVDVPATADTPEAVVRFLIGWLNAEGQLPADELDPLVGLFLKRELLGFTGIGRGLAIPHATSPAIEEPAFVAGRLAMPLDWAAVDGELIALVLLIIMQASGTSAALRSLEERVRRLRGGS